MILDEDTEKSIEKISGNGKEEVTWLVHGSKGSNISIVAYHPKGGKTLKKIKLQR
jgi:hypothetical protein